MNILLVIDFVRGNPGFAAWLIGGLATIIATLVAVYYSLIYQRLGRLEDRVEAIEADMDTYKGMAGANKDVLAELNRSVRAIDDKMSTHGERLARIETKVGALGVNGELGEILRVLRGIIRKAGT